MESRASSRIVNVASAGQQAIDFADVMLTRGYTGGRAICRASSRRSCSPSISRKSSQGRDVAVNCLHPATFMATTMVR